MLALVMLLQSVPVVTESRTMPLLDLVRAECVDENGCPVDGGRRFRLDSEKRPGGDSMSRAMQGVWKPCETTGAPKCPAKGRLILRAPIETN